ncbi:hypothetical protein DB347_06590 [Opitutaceae bacterium EW11]|nr:hypothetical protein DB347_06590 [Opitutaceae bacterium EW11]
MKKLYFIGPIAALGLFAAYTLQFNKAYDAREAQKAAEARIAKEAKLKSEAEARKRALEDAVASQQKLKKERADKEAEETRRKESRQAAIDARDRSLREQERLSRQLDRLKKDVKTEQDAIAKLEASIKYNRDEKTFFNEFVAKAQKNAAAYTELLTKIDAAEAARLAAAAEASKKNS